MPDDLRWNWCNNRNKVHNKYIYYVMCLNHPKPSPGPQSQWKNCLAWNWSLVPERLGTTALHMEALGFYKVRKIPNVKGNCWSLIMVLLLSNSYSDCWVTLCWKRSSKRFMFPALWQTRYLERLSLLILLTASRNTLADY